MHLSHLASYDIIIKNNSKFRASEKPDKLYIGGKVFTRVIQNAILIEFAQLLWTFK